MTKKYIIHHTHDTTRSLSTVIVMSHVHINCSPRNNALAIIFTICTTDDATASRLALGQEQPHGHARVIEPPVNPTRHGCVGRQASTVRHVSARLLLARPPPRLGLLIPACAPRALLESNPVNVRAGVAMLSFFAEVPLVRQRGELTADVGQGEADGCIRIASGQRSPAKLGLLPDGPKLHLLRDGRVAWDDDRKGRSDSEE